LDKAYFQLEHVNMAHLEQHLTMAMFLRQQISTGMGYAVVLATR
jgi:hypothetical protein